MAAVTDVLDHASASLTLHVSDIDVAIGWYTKVFGKELIHRGTDTSRDGESTSFAVFTLAGMKVFLSETDLGGENCGHRHHRPVLVFMTREALSVLRHELEARGAIFRDDEIVDGFPADAHGVRAGRNAEFLWFYDPDGNKMEFCRVLQQVSPR